MIIRYFSIEYSRTIISSYHHKIHALSSYLYSESSVLNLFCAAQDNEGHRVLDLSGQQGELHPKDEASPVLTLYLAHLQALPVDGKATLAREEQPSVRHILTSAVK